ncbi:hypothetical protein HUJ05_001666 [Dendroctonus ponderosae]|nr:hypothetical protein HUJ05_001666 [Dendroctonus ponderosae]
MPNLLLKVKTKNGHQVLDKLTEKNTIKDLKELLSSVSDIPVNRLQVLSGFPPKSLDISKDDLHLDNSGLTTGDTLILQEAAANVEQKTEAKVEPKQVETASNTKEKFIAPTGILMKEVVPADNSCLFSSIHFVLNGKVDNSGESAIYLRRLVAETIRNDKQSFDEAILGKPIEEYCTWIQHETSWGGAIEIAILSNFYGIEIAVVDTVNAIINRFGEDQNYAVRVFLLFDGIHYDPLYLEPFNNTSGGKRVTNRYSSTRSEVTNTALEKSQVANPNLYRVAIF